MKHIEISDGYYASCWGLTDFYPKAEENLKSAIEQTDDFSTEWFGCKKEIRCAKYQRYGNAFIINVTAHMDDLWDGDDLIYDALWDVTKSEEELPQEIIDSIRFAIADEAWIDDSTTISETIPSSEATFERVVEITEQLESEAEENNAKMFSEICSIVKAHVGYMNGGN